MIYVFLANGFEEIEALAPVDLLRRAGHEVRTVAVGCGDDTKVAGAHGIEVIANLRESDFCDVMPAVVILPGGMPGTTNLEESITVWSAANNCVAHGGLLCAICAAPFILGKRGILKGKRATCFPGFENQLEGATVVNAGVVRDGNIITGRAMGSAHDFALTILEALQGKEAADKMRKTIIL
jgi:4-methyl-5(b-hydroxyethyl)-thiazole monophosphate biosynthesis